MNTREEKQIKNVGLYFVAGIIICVVALYLTSGKKIADRGKTHWPSIEIIKGK